MNFKVSSFCTLKAFCKLSSKTVDKHPTCLFGNDTSRNKKLGNPKGYPSLPLGWEGVDLPPF